MNIITKDNCILIDDVAYPKNGFKVSKKSDSVTLSPSSGANYVKVPVEGTTIDGISAVDSAELFDYFVANGFNSGGTEPTNAVLWDNVSMQNLPSTVAQRHENGNLDTGMAEYPENAVNLALMDAKTTLKDTNDTTGVGHVSFWTGTQNEYDLITTPSPSTIYYVK